MLERYPNLIRGVDWQGTLDEFHATIAEEMDYEQEARNAETFRKNFVEWREVYVPQIYHPFLDHPPDRDGVHLRHKGDRDGRASQRRATTRTRW